MSNVSSLKVVHPVTVFNGNNMPPHLKCRPVSSLTSTSRLVCMTGATRINRIGKIYIGSVESGHNRPLISNEDV